MSLKILRVNRIDIGLKSQQQKKENYSCSRTILFIIIAFDPFKHICHKSCCHGMDLVLNGLLWKVFLFSCFSWCLSLQRTHTDSVISSSILLILITILHISSTPKGKREETKRVQMVSVGEQLFQV